MLLGVWLGPATVEAMTSGVSLRQSCAANGSVTLSIRWDGNDVEAIQQWVDLSLFDNNWQWGTFAGAGPYPGETTSLTWTDLPAGRELFMRMNQQLTNGAWDPSPTFSFVTGACDRPSDPEPSPVRAPAPATSFSAGAGCHPSYAGQCLRPSSSDYDCASGGGNGPDFVSGTVRVVGPDVFELDANRNGVGCEP
jgi:hypothetical protein